MGTTLPKDKNILDKIQQRGATRINFGPPQKSVNQKSLGAFKNDIQTSYDSTF